MKIVVIIPVYNERDNTERMIKVMSKIVASITEHKLHVLYVDAASPDGTSEVIKSYISKYSWLHLLSEEKKEGMGMAYAKGMSYAMNELKADYLVEMDGDFQHRPEDLKVLISKINEGYEYIIGSRYIKGGSIPGEWGLDRKLLSILGNLIARACLLLPQVHDVTGGFRISKVKGFMDKFDFSKLLSKRFAYKVHLLYYMVSSKAKFIEVPIQFKHRTSGDSKIIKNDILETFRVIIMIQRKNPKLSRFIKFGLVGGFGLFIQTMTFEIIGLRLKWADPSVATVVGGELAIINNFTFNNLWTFKDHMVTGLKVMLKFVQFNLTSLMSLSIQFVIMRFGEYVASGNNFIIRIFFFGAILIVLVVNYLVYNLVIWRTNKPLK